MSSEKERDILLVMRKVLANIIKDTTPPPGTRHPLSDGTIQDVRQCLGLIALRERELLDAAGGSVSKPYYSDEQPSAHVISIDSISRIKRENDD